jgi:hypothetical protein
MWNRIRNECMLLWECTSYAFLATFADFFPIVILAVLLGIILGLNALFRWIF